MALTKRKEKFIKTWGRTISGISRYEGESHIMYAIRCMLIVQNLLKEYDKGVK